MLGQTSSREELHREIALSLRSSFILSMRRPPCTAAWLPRSSFPVPAGRRRLVIDRRGRLIRLLLAAASLRPRVRFSALQDRSISRV